LKAVANEAPGAPRPVSSSYPAVARNGAGHVTDTDLATSREGHRRWHDLFPRGRPDPGSGALMPGFDFKRLRYVRLSA
jgi:hypothetical protein